MRLEVSGSLCSTGSGSGSTFRSARPVNDHCARSHRESTEHTPQCSAMTSRHGLTTVVGMPPTSDATDKQQVGDSTSERERLYRELRERSERQQRAGNSSSSDCTNSNANVACTRFVDQAGGSSRRSPNRWKVPRRPRTRACRPIPLAPRSTLSSDGLAAAPPTRVPPQAASQT
jgi:hypothetical protein